MLWLLSLTVKNDNYNVLLTRNVSLKGSAYYHDLDRNAEKGGGVLMSVTLPNLKHSFIFPVPVPVPDSGCL